MPRDEEQVEELAPEPTEIVDPDEYQALAITTDSTVDSARIGTRIFVSVKSVCVYLGIQTQGQTTKIRSKPILAQGMKKIKIPSPGGPQDTLCLDFDVFPLWLLDIHPSKTKQELRQTIFNTQIQISRIVRDVYYAYVLANTNPDYAYIIRLLEQVLAEVRENVQNSGELGHAMTMLIQMIGGQVLGPTKQLGLPSRPMLRIVSPQTVEEIANDQIVEATLLMRSRFHIATDKTINFDNQSGQVIIVDANKQQMILDPDQALQTLSILQERRDWLLAQFYEHAPK